MSTGTWEDQLDHFLRRALTPLSDFYKPFLAATGLTIGSVDLPPAIKAEVRRISPSTQSNEPRTLQMLQCFCQEALTMCVYLAEPALRQAIIAATAAEETTPEEKARLIFHAISAQTSVTEPTHTAFQNTGYLLCHTQRVLPQAGIPTAPTGMLLAEWTLIYYAYWHVNGAHEAEIILNSLLRNLRA